MSTTIAAQMIGADFLKLRKRRGTVIWALVLTLAPLLIYFIVRAAQHSSNPGSYSPGGGMSGYTDALRVMAAFFGPLAAIMIGTEGGAGDVAAGVFRDLVVTGRSRVALFASRAPAALALCWLVAGLGYLLLILGTYAFAAGTTEPSGALIANGLAFSLLSTGVVCVVAVGFAALTGSRAAALTVLIGWQLVASPVLANIGSIGDSRKLLLSQAVGHFSPIGLDGDRGSIVTMGAGMAVAVVLVWLTVFLALGAWRTRTMDA
jgi:ABC-type transport system involved in multi-copper enzyme maturation permease subunit